MRTWDDWSNLEVNREMTKIIHNTDGWDLSRCGTLFHTHDKNGYEVKSVIDYCNNPADMWPIIFENRINLNAYDDPEQGWFATTDTSFFVDDINPLRAAAITFLIINGVTP